MERNTPPASFLSTRHGTGCPPELVHGDVIEQLLKAVKDHDIDMIVMATRGETGWRNLLFGSVAEQVIKLAECPVLSIRKPNSAGVVAASGDPPTAA